MFYIFYSKIFSTEEANCSFKSKVDDLDSADDRKSREEAHGTSYSRQLVHKLGFSVLEKALLNITTALISYHRDHIKSGAGEGYLHKV